MTILTYCPSISLCSEVLQCFWIGIKWFEPSNNWFKWHLLWKLPSYKQQQVSKSARLTDQSGKKFFFANKNSKPEIVWRRSNLGCCNNIDSKIDIVLYMNENIMLFYVCVTLPTPLFLVMKKADEWMKSWIKWLDIQVPIRFQQCAYSDEIIT